MHSKKAASILLIIALLGGLVFLHQYLGVFALAALTALLFNPVHEWFLRRRRLARAATGLTIVCIFLALLAPLFTFLGLSFYEANQVVNDVKQQQISDQDIKMLTDKVSQTASGVGIYVSKDDVRAKIKETAQKVVPGIVDFIFRTVGSIATFVTSAIVYVTALAAMLSRKRELLKLIRRLSPFGETIDDEYLGRIKSMAISMVKGTFVIALVVAFISAVTLWIVGIPYVAFWFVLFTLLSLIPLGAGIIYVPMGIILLLTGHIWQGVLILLVQFLILNNVDNVLRPLLAPKDSRLPAALLLVSAFAGVSYFGLVGVIYGPILMVLIYTSIEIYDRHSATGLPLKRSATLQKSM